MFRAAQWPQPKRAKPMTKFTFDITDKLLLAGLSWAREQANAGLSLEKDQAREDHPDYVATDADYLAARMTDVLASYARQAGYDEAELVKAEAEVAARRAAITNAKK